MGRDLYHSSEGQTWRKHKYIRKEGNRYIYPEDVRKESATNWARRDQISEKQMKIEQGIRDRNNRRVANAKTAVPASVQNQQRSVRMDERRRNSSNQMPESDRRTARQVQNREDAANGMRVNKYVENYMPIDKQDYSKELSEDWKNGHNRNLNRFRREKRQSENRSAAANGVGAKNQEFAKNQTRLRNTKKAYEKSGGKPLREIPLNINGKTINLKIDDKQYDRYVAESPDTTPQERAKAITRQRKKAAAANGAGAKNQEYAKAANREQAIKREQRRKESELAKAKRDENARKSGNQAVENAKSAQERAKNSKGKISKDFYDELRSNTKNEKEFNDYLDKSGIPRPDGSKPTTKNVKKVETWDNSKKIKTWDNQTAKKSTNNQKGHFTLSENGETIFVPDDKETKKRVSKGKQIVDKIKSAFSKKKK